MYSSRIEYTSCLHALGGLLLSDNIGCCKYQPLQNHKHIQQFGQLHFAISIEIYIWTNSKRQIEAAMVAVNSRNPRAGSGFAQQPRIATARLGLTFRIQKSEFNRSLRILQQSLPKTANLEDDFPSWDKPACPATLESRQLGSTLSPSPNSNSNNIWPVQNLACSEREIRAIKAFPEICRQVQSGRRFLPNFPDIPLATNSGWLLANFFS